MGTRDGKTKLAALEKAHAPIAELPYMQAQITNSKTSMNDRRLVRRTATLPTDLNPSNRPDGKAAIYRVREYGPWVDYFQIHPNVFAICASCG
jgi:hypothetical protein